MIVKVLKLMKIKFCGGCNPVYNRLKLYQMLLENSRINSSDKTILLNGCQRGCKKITENNNLINIQEYVISNNDLRNINENDIYIWILDKYFK